jgi:hypothetical protein
MSPSDQQLFTIQIKVYDVSEKKLLGIFDSIKAAAKFCGCSTDSMSSAWKKKHRIYKNNLNKTLAIR